MRDLIKQNPGNPIDGDSKVSVDNVNTKADGTGDFYTYDSINAQTDPPTLTMDEENVILYAQWDQLVKIVIPRVKDPHIDYPPGYELEVTDDVINVYDSNGLLIGQWVKSGDTWRYYYQS